MTKTTDCLRITKYNSLIPLALDEMECEIIVANTQITASTKKDKVTIKIKVVYQIFTMTLYTEDTGKMFEMAICLAYHIDYDGVYKYDIQKAQQLCTRLSKLQDLFPTPKHTARKGARYDFTTEDNKHLSAKTTKHRGGKVAPQVIGQSQPKKFCDLIGIPYISVASLKEYIQQNVPSVLQLMVQYTFDCPNIYYNDETKEIQYITLEHEIDWNNFTYIWTRDCDNWTNSSTLKIQYQNKYIPLGEFQFHTKSRTNMAIRWYYENFIQIFQPNLHIDEL